MPKTFVEEKKEKFTIPQALIAFALVGILFAVSTTLLLNARKNNRDIKRIADVAMVRNALELYFYDCNKYPTEVTPGQTITGVTDCNGSIYLSKVPVDPQTGAAYAYLPCTGEGETLHCDFGLQNATGYYLGYILEGNIGGITMGKHMASQDSMY